MTDTSQVPAESGADGQGRGATAATLPCAGANAGGGRRGPRWRGWAAAAVGGWSVFYVVMGAFWSMGGAGYPFGRNDRGGPEAGSLLSGVERDPGARAVLLFGLLATLTALAMHRRSGTGRSRTALIAAGCVIVAVLVGVVMDARSITLLPPLGLVGWALIPDWPTLNQLIVGLGALGWTAATVGYIGDTRVLTRPPVEHRARSSARWVLAGRVAVVVAVLCPLPYAVIRWSWALDRPIGTPASFVEMLGRNQPGVAVMEAVLASFACVGAVPAAQPHLFTDAAVYLPQVARHLGRSELARDPGAVVPDVDAITARSRQYVAFFDAHLRARDAALLEPGERCRAGVCISVSTGPRPAGGVPI